MTQNVLSFGWRSSSQARLIETGVAHPERHSFFWNYARSEADCLGFEIMDLKLPNLGEGADSGTVVNLFVKEGDQISKNEAGIGAGS